MEHNIYNQFYYLLCEIAYGLKSKEAKYKKLLGSKVVCDKQYIKDQYLIRVLNKLYVFALKNNLKDSEGNILAPRDETDALTNYFSRNISDWMEGWSDDVKSVLEPFCGMEPLIQLRGGGKYLCNESCFELALQCTLYDKDAEQRQLFNVLKSLSQEAYVACRKYIITHPIIDSLNLGEFRIMLNELGLDERRMNKIIDYAYEPIPDDAAFECLCCGWTVSRTIDGSLCCIESRCKHNTDNFKKIEKLGDTRNLRRLKPGVMRYMSIPGKLELLIEKYCLKNDIKYELWPNKDDYDIKITMPNGRILAIDAKDYRNAFVLGKNIQDNNTLFCSEDWNEGYIVVPDESVEQKVDYCKVINKVLRRKIGNMSCITFSELIERIREVH